MKPEDIINEKDWDPTEAWRTLAGIDSRSFEATKDLFETIDKSALAQAILDGPQPAPVAFSSNVEANNDSVTIDQTFVVPTRLIDLACGIGPERKASRSSIHDRPLISKKHIDVARDLENAKKLIKQMEFEAFLLSPRRGHYDDHEHILRQAMWRELDHEIMFVNVTGKTSIDTAKMIVQTMTVSKKDVDPDAITPVDFSAVFEGVTPIPEEAEPVADDPLKP
jgi:hypothetical protein